MLDTTLKPVTGNKVAALAEGRRMVIATDAASGGIGIAAMERETGISRETLRIWERRYGSPSPVRGSGGARRYDRADVHRLRLVKALLGRGFKPAAVVGETVERLAAMYGALPSSQAGGPPSGTVVEGLSYVERRMPVQFGRWLRRRLTDIGLKAFVLDVARPLLRAIGEEWQEGRFRIYQEHVATEQLQAVLRSAVQAIEPEGNDPAILLTTLPGEPHVMGLLMLEALLRLRGVDCHYLGAQTPVEEIAACCADGSYRIVALSFSGAFPTRAGAERLAALRKALPLDVGLWVGGAGAAPLRAAGGPSGITLMDDLEDAVAALAQSRPAVPAWNDR